jgi:uncharacterized membrane protein
MENEVIKYEKMKFALQLAGIASLSSMVAAGIIGFSIIGLLGILGGPMIVIIKGYIVLPVVFIFYAAAWFAWKKTTMPRLDYCLSIAGSVALVLALVAIQIREQYWLLRVIGFPLGGFIPLFASLWLMTKYKTEKVMHFHQHDSVRNCTGPNSC